MGEIRTVKKMKIADPLVSKPFNNTSKKLKSTTNNLHAMAALVNPPPTSKTRGPAPIFSETMQNLRVVHTVRNSRFEYFGTRLLVLTAKVRQRSLSCIFSILSRRSP